MFGLEVLSDEELDDFRNQGRLVGPLSNLALDELIKIISSIGDNNEKYSQTKNTSRIADSVNEAEHERIVFGIGYISTENGLKRSIQSYRIIDY